MTARELVPAPKWQPSPAGPSANLPKVAPADQAANLPLATPAEIGNHLPIAPTNGHRVPLPKTSLEVTAAPVRAVARVPAVETVTDPPAYSDDEFHHRLDERLTRLAARKDRAGAFRADHARRRTVAKDLLHQQRLEGHR